MAGTMFGWFFVSALYLQLVLDYRSRARLPTVDADLGRRIFASLRSARHAIRIKPPLVAGLVLFTLGLVLFARAPTDGKFTVDAFRA